MPDQQVELPSDTTFLEEVSISVLPFRMKYLETSGTLNTQRIIIRGVGSRTPYSSNRIRAYLDDIPLTSGDGISILEGQDILVIGSMEVLKGPPSAIYGSGLGGVIRLNSSYPAHPGWKASLITEAGSFGMRRNALSGNSRMMGRTTAEMNFREYPDKRCALI